MKTKSLLLLIALLVVSTFVQAKKVQLSLKLEKGANYEMLVGMTNDINQEVQGQSVKIIQKIDMNLLWKVIDVLPNKNYQLEYSIQKIKLNMNVNGQEMVFDSEDASGSNPLNEPLKNLDSLKLKIEVTDLGKIVQVEGVDAFQNKFGGDQMLKQSLQMFSDKNSLESFIGQTFNYFPGKKVGVGDQWSTDIKLPSTMDMALKVNYQVAKIKEDRLDLTLSSAINADAPMEQGGMKMQMKMNGTQSGTMSVNRKDGWLNESAMNQKFDITIKIQGASGGMDMEIPMKMNSVSNVKVNRK